MRHFTSTAVAFLAAFALMGICNDSALADEPLIVVVRAKSSGPYEDVLNGFRDSLKGKGVQGRFDVHTLGEDVDEIDRILGDAVSNGADLILTIGSNVTDLVVEKNPAVPVVYSLVMASEHVGRINCTGVVLEFSLEAHFDWMRRFLPKARKIGVLYNPENNGERITKAKRRAAKYGFVLEAEKVEKPQDIPLALERIGKKVDVLWGIPDDVVLNQKTAKQLLVFCYRNKIPFIGPSKAWVKAGALYALDRDYADIGSQCAEIAAAIVVGEEINSIESQSPKKISYFVNMNTVRHMKLDINKQLLAKADGVY